jgi:hypothetical protein
MALFGQQGRLSFTAIHPAVAAPDGQDLGSCRPGRKLGRTGQYQHARPAACSARRHERQRRNARVRTPRKRPSGMYQVRDVRCPVVVGGYLATNPTHFEIKDSDERGTTVEHRTWRSGYKPGSAAWHPASPEVGFADATRHRSRRSCPAGKGSFVNSPVCLPQPSLSWPARLFVELSPESMDTLPRQSQCANMGLTTHPTCHGRLPADHSILEH